MAYADLFSETMTVPAGGDYFIKIKTSLTHADKEAADKHLHKVRGSLDDRGKVQAITSPDLIGYNRVLVSRSIVDWNLDEDDGTKWALTPEQVKEHNVGRLPNLVFERLLKHVEALNRPDPAEERAFRHEDSGSDQDGDTGAADFAAVSVGDDAVDEAGDTC